jgi:hypothetical protein
MKVLLRNTQTGLFYAGPEQWTHQQTEATDFEAPDRALDQVSHGKLSGVEVVIHFEETQFNIPLTIVSSGG